MPMPKTNDALVYRGDDLRSSGPSEQIWRAIYLAGFHHEILEIQQELSHFGDMFTHLARWMRSEPPTHPLRVSLDNLWRTVENLFKEYGGNMSLLVRFYSHETVDMLDTPRDFKAFEEKDYLDLFDPIFQHNLKLIISGLVQRIDQTSTILKTKVRPALDEVQLHLEPWTRTKVETMQASQRGILGWINAVRGPSGTQADRSISHEQVAQFPSQFALGSNFFARFDTFIDRMYVWMKRLQEIWDTPEELAAVGLGREEDFKQLYLERLESMSYANLMYDIAAGLDAPFSPLDPQNVMWILGTLP